MDVHSCVCVKRKREKLLSQVWSRTNQNAHRVPPFSTWQNFHLETTWREKFLRILRHVDGFDLLYDCIILQTIICFILKQKFCRTNYNHIHLKNVLKYWDCSINLSIFVFRKKKFNFVLSVPRCIISSNWNNWLDLCHTGNIFFFFWTSFSLNEYSFQLISMGSRFQFWKWIANPS